MCGENESTPLTGVSTEGCCKDKMSFFVVASNLSPSIFQKNQSAIQLLPVFDIPRTLGIQRLHTYSIKYTNVQPHGN